MIITSTATIPGRRIVVIRGRATGRAIAALAVLPAPDAGHGADLRSDLAALDRARAEARHRLGQAAAALGADAVVRVQLTSDALGTDALEVMATGTAVVLGPPIDDGSAGGPTADAGVAPR